MNTSFPYGIPTGTSKPKERRSYEPPGTTGSLGSVSPDFFSLEPQDYSVVKPVLDIIRTTTDASVAAQALKLLSTFHELLLILHQNGFPVRYLPPLHAVNISDGSILIEWIFADFRIGFTIESNSRQSGWYFVSNGGLGQSSNSGLIANTDIKGLLLRLVGIVLTMA